MNKKILQRVVDELKKEKPDLSYIRGVLETLIDGLIDTTSFTERITMPLSKHPDQRVEVPRDEEVKVRLDNIKNLIKYD